MGRRPAGEEIFELDKKLKDLLRLAGNQRLRDVDNQAKLAKHIGIDASQLNRMISGELRTIRPECQEPLASCFKFNVDWPEWHDRTVGRRGDRLDQSRCFQKKLEACWDAPPRVYPDDVLAHEQLFFADPRLKKIEPASGESDWGYEVHAVLQPGRDFIPGVGSLSVHRGDWRVELPIAGAIEEDSQFAAQGAEQLADGVTEVGAVRGNARWAEWSISNINENEALVARVRLDAPWCRLPISHAALELKFFVKPRDLLIENKKAPDPDKVRQVLQAKVAQLMRKNHPEECEPSSDSERIMLYSAKFKGGRDV